MPLFKLIHRLQPCLLCGQNPAQQYQLCGLCWQDLPWKKQIVTRHALECQVIFPYVYPLDHILQRFKDQAALHYLPFLTAALSTIEKPRIQAIVPMPLATEKLIQRGFNQSILLAQQLARQWQIPIWQPIARLSRHSQRGLDRLDRLHNLEQQFYALKTQAKYKHVLMLDDVITTGASLGKLKEQLQQLGCTHVQALCLCDAQQC
ncbi:ComF family protein [Acinetobacter qingfengensis]|uniref:Uncharacterized protein n=1 Tax=Acinetobacter qingfengensis TaxID=1262585 RepID=A0A1E7R2U0_9GAMM|nr:ComF family protein [Acinetobacter qingfengensis]KAA8733843.1 ComF family protein [Acinetobacter qingfengensis]OEY93644.1 hypothetical protein BJI46_04160 [Acinetobacter qingfengensis]